MLAIRMQRTGRKGHATFRVVVQDSRQAPTSGKFVALLGGYDPHTKKAELIKEKADFYLEHGAQPSPRVARLFKSEGIKLPGWVKIEPAKERAIRNPEKLRKNRSADAEPAEAPAEEQATEAAVAESDEKPEQPKAAKETAEAESTPAAEVEAPAEPAEKPSSDQ